jgi:hypothetical protein
MHAYTIVNAIPARVACRYSCVGNRQTFCWINLMLAKCIKLAPRPQKPFDGLVSNEYRVSLDKP